MESQDYNKQIVLLCLAIFILNLVLINNCPFHVDYIQYSKSINRFYGEGIIDGNVNGKYIYVYLMALFIMPLYAFGISTLASMIIITGLFQAILVWLFYKCTNSILKTYLMATTLTFLMFIGHPETIMLASIFMLLFFINRDKPYSEFFIMLASLIRLDFAVYYLFARKKTVILPITFTFLQWFNRKLFVDSDFGINEHILTAGLVFFLSYGTYLLLFAGLGKLKEKNIDWMKFIGIVLFIIIFLKFPSQKIFFFPVILSFIIYDFKEPKRFKWIITAFMLINIFGAVIMQYNRYNLCTSEAFSEYGLEHEENIHFGVFQPYLDYYGLNEEPPYAYRITQSCSGSADYMIAEDWRNAQLFFLSYKFCLEPYQIE